MHSILRIFACGARPQARYLDGQTPGTKAQFGVSVCRIASGKREPARQQDICVAPQNAPRIIAAPPSTSAPQGFSEHHIFWEGSWRAKRGAPIAPASES